MNGRPLRFFHFTKVDGVGDTMLETYAGDNAEAFEMLAWYKRELRRRAGNGLAGLPWHFGRFSNGVPVSRAARRPYRVRRDLMAHLDDPFDAERRDSLYNWLLTEQPGMLDWPASPAGASATPPASRAGARG